MMISLKKNYKIDICRVNEEYKVVENNKVIKANFKYKIKIWRNSLETDFFLHAQRYKSFICREMKSFIKIKTEKIYVFFNLF